MAGKNPIKFTDTTFRDGHQSLLATRMRTEDIVPFMERMDQMGYWAIEVWGGATFDTTHRFLGDDPWERIRTIKGILKKTPTMMLLRGQNLVGYRNYADDLTYRFVRYTAEAGVDIFRVFDALNDMRNWEVSVKALMDAKKQGLMAHFQAAVCYSLTQRRLGGPIFNLEYYVDFAKKSEDMGADSFVLKDMAGMCSPNDAYAIIKAVKETIKIPVEFHTHYTSGSGSMSYLKAIEAGVDVLDTCLCPFALRTSQPAIEPLIVAVEQTERETDMDLASLIEIGQDLEKVAVKYRDLLDTSKMAQIDTGVLLHQIPGGMYSNLVNQLKEANALDRILEVNEADLYAVIEPGVTWEQLKAHLAGAGIRNSGFIHVDVWENSFESFSIARRTDCPTCGKGEYDYLKGERTGAATAYLCGRDAVQVNPGSGHAVSLPALAERLRPVGQVSVNEYLVKFTIDQYELTIFPDARAIVKGTDDAAVARSLYAKYVGI